MRNYKLLSIDSCFCSHSGRGNSLTVNRVGNIACRKHAGNVCGCGYAYGFYVALLVEVDELFKDIGVGFMSDSKEETVDTDVERFLLVCAFKLNQMGTFNAVVAE